MRGQHKQYIFSKVLNKSSKYKIFVGEDFEQNRELNWKGV